MNNALRSHLYNVLHHLDLDKNFIKAENAYLYTDKEKIIDFVGGYGAAFYGHNRKELVDELIKIYSEGVPTCDQFSIREHTVKLANELQKMVAKITKRTYRVLFSNTGAEANEVALKAIALYSNRNKIISLKKSYHGKTYATANISDGELAKEFLNKNINNVIQLDLSNSSWKDNFHSIDPQEVSSLWIEPIQGEGGIKLINKRDILFLQSWCHKFSIPLVFDEVQTGMGRTGPFLAQEHFGIYGDIITLGKSLGGGLSKISATLISEEYYRSEIEFMHSSTFAEDSPSSIMAFKTLDLYKQDKLKMAHSSTLLEKELKKLGEEFPQIFEIRGRGHMWGIEVKTSSTFSAITQALFKKKMGGHIIASYLLNHFQIRVLPTLQAPNVLRLGPSYLITNEDIKQLIQGFKNVAHSLQNHVPLYFNTLRGYSKEKNYNFIPSEKETFLKKPTVGFIVHFLDENTIYEIEPALKKFSNESVKVFLKHSSQILGGLEDYNELIVKTPIGTINMNLWMLPVTSQELMDSLREGRPTQYLSMIENIISRMKNRGIKTVGLGGMTSIVTLNGKALKSDVNITTGNAFTVSSSFYKSLDLCKKRGYNRVAVLGAMGNIGEALVRLSLEHFSKILLIGRKGSIKRLEKFAQKFNHSDILVSTDIEDINEVDLVFCASNTSETLLKEEHIKSPLICCDISVPQDAAIEVRKHPLVTYFQGGIIELPKESSFSLSDQSLPANHCYACMAETLLLGLSDNKNLHNTGKLNLDHIKKIHKLAIRADFKTIERG